MKSILRAATLLMAVAPGMGAAAETEGTANHIMPPSKLATLFGAREQVRDISISPDGKQVVLVTPGVGRDTLVAIINIEKGDLHPIAKVSPPLDVDECGWASNSRVVCREVGVVFNYDPPVPFTRTVSIDDQGKNQAYLGRRPGIDALRVSQFDGRIIDWGPGDGTVLMTRDYVPTKSTGTLLGGGDDGIGVDRVDAATGRGTMVERATKGEADYLSDGQGNVRMRWTDDTGPDGILTGGVSYMYRQADNKQWRQFSHIKPGESAFRPIAVDGTRNVAYAVKTLNGRDAIYGVALDGSFKADLVASNPEVDVKDVITIGRHGRVIGADYLTDRRQLDYFDPEYKKLSAALSRAIPKTPNIAFLGASSDEQKLLVLADSDTDPGHYYLYDKGTHQLGELVKARPELANITMAPMQHIAFKASDGTTIPAYLTMPVGGATKHLPAIVMPHGGPDYRDGWGFDWLVQFFAARGYAVIQPEYRGSSGYGDAFLAQNAYHNWRTAMGDISDAGRYLVKEGIADPAKLAIVGWSYGGYAALQANVVDPNLFKAIVAIAPVTDLSRLKNEARGYTNSNVVAEQVGSGSIVTEGSPARHADRIIAPVLLFHGDHDLNVGVAESREMDAALRRAGKRSTLVVFPGLDHQLEDPTARATMLDQADKFLRTTMNIAE